MNRKQLQLKAAVITLAILVPFLVFFWLKWREEMSPLTWLAFGGFAVFLWLAMWGMLTVKHRDYTKPGTKP
ncbi:MAG: hypothetical protein Q4C71_03475 [Microbacteriaceae bacterium]|nr:hypothetical protein [Microbacteriaceae bacterium]